jgi:hypothetical protein
MIDWKDVTSGFVAQVLATLAIPVVLYLAARLATIATSRSRSANVRNWIIPSEIETAFDTCRNHTGTDVPSWYLAGWEPWSCQRNGCGDSSIGISKPHE